MRLKKKVLDAVETVAAPAKEFVVFDDGKLRADIASLQVKIDKVLAKQNEPEPVEPEDKPKQWTFDVMKDRDGAIVKVVARETVETVVASKPDLGKVLYG
jgi:hypothetical protein